MASTKKLNQWKQYEITEIMEFENYLKIFQKSILQVDEKVLAKKHLDIYVGVYLDSVVLKLYKKEWTNDKTDPINAKTRIFFSIWASEENLKQNKIFYNIHAFKLRHLKGYTIKSREFANVFRSDFQEFKHEWDNVSLKHGPLTLMEGWNSSTIENLETNIVKLVNSFLRIEHLIDESLLKFKSKKINGA